MPDMGTIHQTAERLKSVGLPLSEYTLRLMVKRGVIPVRYAGNKALIYFPNVLAYLKCTDGCDNAPATVAAAPGIRRADL